MTTTQQPEAAPSIRETVSQTLPQQYLSYGGDAISALEQREQQIVTGLTEFARSKGLDDDEIREAFASVGLTMPEPPSALGAETSESGDHTLQQVLQEVRNLAQRIESASQQASRHGIRF